MAQESGRRAMEYGGITSHDIVLCKDAAECHRKKLSGFLDYEEPVWFIDADWWMVTKVSLPTPEGPLCIGAPNDSGTDAYADSAVPTRSALCSCLIGLDMDCHIVRHAVGKALYLQGKDRGRDEIYLNKALFEDARLCPVRLSNYWNWCAPPVPLTVGLHGAKRPDRMAWLVEMSALFKSLAQR